MENQQAEQNDKGYGIQIVCPKRMEWVTSHETYSTEEAAFQAVSQMREVARIVKL